MTYPELMQLTLEGKYIKHHTSYVRGYVSRRLKPADYPVKEYEGKFGKGYTVKTPNSELTRYCFITYFIKMEHIK